MGIILYDETCPVVSTLEEIDQLLNPAIALQRFQRGGIDLLES